MQSTIRPLLFFLFLIYGLGISDAQVKQELSDLHPESAYLHLSTNLLFPGDYLFYSCYILDRESLRPSTASKLVYIELVDQNRKVLLKKSLFLREGKASSDIFINTEIPTGNYKLIAYTNWMRNQSTAPFFSSDITIINPYMEQNTLANNTFLSGNSGFSKAKEVQSATSRQMNASTNTGFITLSMERANLGSREKASLRILSENQNMQGGRYSLSIRKILDIPVNDLPTATMQRPLKKENEKDVPVLFLPELRGKIISGKLSNTKNTKSDVSAQVALSVVGQPELFNIATTDKDGTFTFSVPYGATNKTAFLEVLDRSDLQIAIKEYPPVSYESLTFPELSLLPEFETAILEKSIHNQIETAYFSVKPDSIFPEKITPLFGTNQLKTYRLDEFTRFPTLEETFREILSEVRIRNRKTGKRLSVRTPPSALFENWDALVLLDGLLIQNHSTLLMQSAIDIEQISVSPFNIFLGNRRYQGSIMLSTASNKDKVVEVSRYALSLPAFQPKKRYYSPKYEYGDTSLLDHIPDYRYQLFWEGNLMLMPHETNINFVTSDVRGKFEVALEGYTEMGIPISERLFFVVE